MLGTLQYTGQPGIIKDYPARTVNSTIVEKPSLPYRVVNIKHDNECNEFDLFNCYSRKTSLKITTAFERVNPKRPNFSSICNTCQGRALCQGFHALLFRSDDRLTEIVCYTVY